MKAKEVLVRRLEEYICAGAEKPVAVFPWTVNIDAVMSVFDNGCFQSTGKEKRDKPLDQGRFPRIAVTADTENR